MKFKGRAGLRPAPTNQELIAKLRSGEDLTREESKEAVFAMMEGRCEPAQTAELLSLLHVKGETAEELIGFAQAMLQKSLQVDLDGMRVLDTCGTGGDKKNTFNISTLAAFVLAGCGIPVAKHGNRAASSACGSADLLEALGICYQLKPEQIGPALEETRFAFLFAPYYHPATKAVVTVRKQLGTPTIFNLLGPLTNPARPAAQVIGAYDSKALPLMEEAVRKMDPGRRVFFVHSSEGHDEATTSGEFELRSTFRDAARVHPSEFGFDRCPAEDLCGGSPQENAAILMEVLSGVKGSRRNVVVLNAMLGYLAYHAGASVEQARDAVLESIDTGKALHVVQKCREVFAS